MTLALETPDHCTTSHPGHPAALHYLGDAEPHAGGAPGYAQPARDALRPDAARTPAIWRESLNLIQQHVPFSRRLVRRGETVYHYGDAFGVLYLASTGLYKMMILTPDGREQPSGLVFRGDWLGFDGIPTGHHDCSAVALDTGELWSVHYSTLLAAAAREPSLMRLMLAAMGEQMARSRETAISMGTLSADARVADFLLHWAQCLKERGLRADKINVPLSRAEIGTYLGIRLESVSRALNRLSRLGVILFNEGGRRAIAIPSLAALGDFVLNGEPAPHAVLQ